MSGYFDPFHVGHLEYLEKSKEAAGGDKNAHLIVIVNNDHQATLKKGKPFMPAAERCKIVAALRCVDEAFVAVDEDRTCCKSIACITPPPDYFCNGGDQNNNTAWNHFGAGDIPMTASRFNALRTAGRTMVHVPFAMGGIGVFFNIPGSPSVELTGCLLAKIFSRQITHWNDAEITALNPDLTYSGEIKVVHRVHGSSSTSPSSPDGDRRGEKASVRLLRAARLSASTVTHRSFARTNTAPLRGAAKGRAANERAA